MPTVELFGQARLLAGVRSVSIEASTLGDALHVLSRLHPELVGTVLTTDGQLTSAYTVNVNGLRFCNDPAEPLREPDELLVISSLSGG